MVDVPLMYCSCRLFSSELITQCYPEPGRSQPTQVHNFPEVIVIPNSFANSGREKGLTMRMDQPQRVRGLKVGLAQREVASVARPHRECTPTLGPSLARFQRTGSG